MSTETGTIGIYRSLLISNPCVVIFSTADNTGNIVEEKRVLE